MWWAMASTPVRQEIQLNDLIYFDNERAHPRGAADVRRHHADTAGSVSRRPVHAAPHPADTVRSCASRVNAKVASFTLVITTASGGDYHSATWLTTAQESSTSLTHPFLYSIDATVAYYEVVWTLNLRRHRRCSQISLGRGAQRKLRRHVGSFRAAPEE